GISSIGSGLIPSLNTWQLVGISFDSHSPTNNALFILDNKAARITYDEDFSTTAFTNQIGKWKTDPDRFFNGLIGHVWIYSRALTFMGIQRNYLATKWRYQ
ncbi:hypothetical protein LCGC14_2995080, partial [marine sediment metagenome]